MRRIIQSIGDDTSYSDVIPEVVAISKPRKERIKARAYLTVLMDNEDATFAEEAVGISADRRWQRGQRRSRRVSGTHAYSGFEFSSPLSESEDAADHVVALVERLRPAASALRDLGAQRETHSVRLTVVEHTRSDNPMVGLEAETVQRIADMGAQFVVDIYLVIDDE